MCGLEGMLQPGFLTTQEDSVRIRGCFFDNGPSIEALLEREAITADQIIMRFTVAGHDIARDHLPTDGDLKMILRTPAVGFFNKNQIIIRLEVFDWIVCRHRNAY